MFFEWFQTGLFRFFTLMLRVEFGAAFPKALSREEEARLFEQKQKGDRAARDTLIEHNLRLVAHIIKKYYTDARDQEDLISIGTVGLIKAIDSFRPENGARFATYGGKCVQNEILMHFRSRKKYANETSVHETLEVDKDGNPLTILDVIAVEDDTLEAIDLKTKLALVREGIRKRLSPREKKIIVLRYGLLNGRGITQREAAEKLGISRSYVSRIEKAALEKLRLFLTESGQGP